MKQDCKRSGGDMRQRHGAYFQFKQNKEEWQISEIIDNKVTTNSSYNTQKPLHTWT